MWFLATCLPTCSRAHHVVLLTGPLAVDSVLPSASRLTAGGFPRKHDQHSGPVTSSPWHLGKAGDLAQTLRRSLLSPSPSSKKQPRRYELRLQLIRRDVRIGGFGHPVTTRAGEDKHAAPFLELAKRVDQAVGALKQTGPTVTIED